MNEYDKYLRLVTPAPAWRGEGIEFRAVLYETGKPLRAVKRLSFEEVEEGTILNRSFVLYGPQAQELMDFSPGGWLATCGLQEHAGQLDAVEKHLRDMRAIAFNKLEIQQP